MELSFWIKFALGFLVGGIWVTLSSIAAERFGSKVGGLIGGLPSTIVVTLLFIGLTQTAARAAQSAIIVPLVMGINGIFITVFIYLSRRGLAPALAGALLVWFCLASIPIVLNIQALWLSILVWLLLGIGCFLVVEKGMKIISQGRKTTRYTANQVSVWPLNVGFDLLVAAAVAISTMAIGVIGTFTLVFVPASVAFRVSPGWRRAVVLSAAFGALSYVPAFGGAILLDQPFARRRPRREVVFAVDTSLSMAGAPLERARRVVREALLELPATDGVNVVAFDSVVQQLFETADDDDAPRRTPAGMEVIGDDDDDR